MDRIITEDEFKLRISKIQSSLKESNIGALLVTLGKNFQYILGSKAKPSERLTLGIISSQDKSPHLICPAFEVTNFQKTTPVPKDNIIPWEETESPFVKSKEILQELSLSDSMLALSPQAPYTHFKKLEEQLPNSTIIDGYAIFRNARIQKTDNELTCLRKANEVTAQGIEATFAQLENGLTEKEVASILSKELSSRSGEATQFAAVQFGENSADPHGLPTDRKLKNNETVLIDAGTTIEGYNGDITNTTFFGKPTQEFLDIYDIVEESQQKAVEKSVIGVSPEDVDNEARSIITKKGYGKFFTHRTGHGIGLDVHEDPYIVGNNRESLLKNTAHSIEPGIYLEGKFGVRIEDIVIVDNNKSATRTAKVHRRFWEK